MAPVIANTFRVALNWEGPSPAIAENVIHIFSSTGDAADVGDALEAAMTSDMWQMVSDAYEITSFDVTELIAVPLTINRTAPNTGDWQGQASGDYFPNSCALVKHLTATGGRSGRGRTYLPALAESRQSNGVTAPTQRALTTAAWNQFEADLLAFTPACSLVVASYTNSSVAAVVTSICEAPIATQRRRLIR